MEVEEPAPKYYPEMSPPQFLEWERAQQCRHEFVNGQIMAMAGASFRHNQIFSNILITVGYFLKGKSCDIFGSDLRISVKWKDSFFYPDAVIVCDEPEFEDDKIKDTLKNPSVIFEILSPSTEDYDMGKKQMYYMQIESLKQYIMVDSRKMNAFVITRRNEERTWKFDALRDAADKLCIEPINLEISLAGLYEGVKF